MPSGQFSDWSKIDKCASADLQAGRKTEKKILINRIVHKLCLDPPAQLGIIHLPPPPVTMS